MSDEILSRKPPAADLRVAYGADRNQFIDLRFPAKRAKAYPLAVNIHGGFWRAKYSLDHAGHCCAALTSRGLATANLEYRRVGNEGGGWPGTFGDIRSAYQFLIQNAQKHNFDARRVVVMGHSAGGQLALCLAAHEPDVKNVVSLAGVVDLRRAHELHLSDDAAAEFLGGTTDQIPEYYREADPMRLSMPQARQLLLQGSNDDIVPPEFSQGYVAAKRKRSGTQREDVHLIEIPGASHFDLIDPHSDAWKLVEDTVVNLTI